MTTTELILRLLAHPFVATLLILMVGALIVTAVLEKEKDK